MESRWSLLFAVGILVAGAFAQSSVRQCDPFVHDAHPSNCTKFTNCYGGANHQFSCLGNLFFDTETQRCESHSLPGCNDDGTPTTIDPCSRNPCRQPQQCHVTNANTQRYECRCPVGWQGPSCDRDVDECSSFGNDSPCKTGRCINTVGSFHCDCRGTGNHGMRCERPGEVKSYDACTPRPCGAHGWCSVDSLSPNGYKCHCNNGFSGEHCTQSTGTTLRPTNLNGACARNPCGSNGRCVPSNFNQLGYTCQCNSGFQGQTCAQDIDECRGTFNQCNNGQCQNTYGSFQCNCYAGWSGDRCDRPTRTTLRPNINACARNPCGSNGRCVPSNFNQLGYTCQCNSGFQGQTCSQDIDECRGTFNQCNNGRCQNTYGSFQCNCYAGWNGDRCDKPTRTTLRPNLNACARNPCGSNGRCVPSNFNQLGYTCQCNSGFQGQTCSQDIDECRGVFNQCNNGQCQNTYGSFQCNCYAGWTGDRCDRRTGGTNACASRPCGNNGQCTVNASNFNGYTCQCNAGFSGQTCSQDIDECQTRRPCVNGRCENTSGSYRCNCYFGWTGLNCSRRG